MFPDLSGVWYGVKDGDRRALDIFERHYSCYEYKDGRERNLFVGPGYKMVLMTVDCDALFVWRKFKSRDNQQGVNCSVFRNEAPKRKYVASELILEAMGYAWARWPGERLFTYVNAEAVQSTNPGYCFLKAGWDKLDYTTKVNKLLIFECLPE